MNEISTEVKKEKFNIIQKIRLGIFKMRKFDIKRYAKAPEYIKKDDMIVSEIINNIYFYDESDLLLIPSDKLYELLESESLWISEFSKEKQIEFIREKPSLVQLNSDEELFELIDIEINKGNNDFIQVVSKTDKLDKLNDYMSYLRDNQRLDETLPYILKYMPENIIENKLKEKTELLSYLTEEQQVAYMIKHPESIKYADSRIQLEFVSKNPEHVKNAKEEIQERWMIQQQDKRNLANTSDRFQMKLISKYPGAYDYASDFVKEKIFKDFTDPLHIQAQRNLLKKDIRYSKHLDAEKIAKESETTEVIIEMFRDINLESPEFIKNMFLHYKIMDAKGKLISAKKVLHGAMSEERGHGRDNYNSIQVQIVQTLNPHQIQELVEIDSNYILPYLTGVSGLADSEVQIMSDNEIQESKNRCKQLFINMFGEQKFYDLQDCIDLIYLLQESKQEIWEKSTTGTIKTGEYGDDKFKKIAEIENIPLHYFKILFNEKIISSNSTEDIKKYFEDLRQGEETSEIFKMLMEKAYGHEAREIMDSRPGLNVHTINSLESFDNRILDNFGLAFVHDLQSYNIRDFSSFLSVIKDETRLENFKTYYEVISKIMGSNVETMQRTISEFMYYEELLENVRDVNLTEEQYENLLSVLCSRENLYEINTLEDLENYKEIANKKTKEALLQAYNTSKSESESDSLKRCICQYFLGLDYYRTSKHNERDYGDKFSDITQLYDIQSEKSKQDMYSESELRIFEVLDFINNESDSDKLMEFANQLINQEVTRNPILLYKSIDKMKNRQNEIFNESLLTVDKMEELCKEEEGKENPLIVKDVINGVTRYILRGIPFNILAHNPSGLSLNNFLEYDGQFGNSAICCRVVTDKNVVKDEWGKFGFSGTETSSGLIAKSGWDANTDHSAKLVKAVGTISRKINSDMKDERTNNEASVYRRARNHDLINNENHGGKRLPDMYLLYTRNNDYNIETLLDELKEKNIPAVCIDLDIYEELNRQQPVQESEIERE